MTSTSSIKFYLDRIRRDRLGWMLCDKNVDGHSKSAVRQMFVAGECFFARLEYFGEEGEWGAYVTVLAGNNVAHDFRVEMRMSSRTRYDFMRSLGCIVELSHAILYRMVHLVGLLG